MCIGFFLLLMFFTGLVLSLLMLCKNERFGIVLINIKIFEIFCLNRVLFVFFRMYFLFLRILIRVVLV